jgi:hypothetical protein
MSRAVRETLKGTGEHIAAERLLGADYSNAEYVDAITAAREAGVGEAYASKVLGVDLDAQIHGVEYDGDAIVRAAESRLRRRGIDPKKATYREYADALAGVSA